MKILFITPTLPARISRIRAYNLIKCLSGNHEVHLLSFIDSNTKKNKIEEIKKFCTSIDTVLLPKWKSFLSCILYLFTNIPLRVSYCKSGAMKKKIGELLAKEKFDVVYIKRKRMAQYGEYITGIPKVLDLTDAVSMYYSRAYKYSNPLKKIYFFIEYHKLLKYEIRITRKFDKVVLSSAVDAEFLNKNSGGDLKNLVVIPNVVDTEYYSPKNIKSEENSLLFSGIMRNFVNIDSAVYFCRNIFPLILKEIPDTKLYIAGPKPPLSVRRFSKCGNIIVTGYVDDLRDYIEKSEIIICPIRVGAGTRNKILQAMSFGKPVVSTCLGAEGLKVTDNENILIADTSREFAEKVIILLKDKTMREKIGMNAKRFVCAKYSLDILKEKINMLLDNYLKK